VGLHGRRGGCSGAARISSAELACSPTQRTRCGVGTAPSVRSRNGAVVVRCLVCAMIIPVIIPRASLSLTLHAACG